MVIDGATEIDAGTYVVNASIPQQTFLPVTEEVNVEFGRYFIHSMIYIFCDLLKTLKFVMKLLQSCIPTTVLLVLRGLMTKSFRLFAPTMAFLRHRHLLEMKRDLTTVCSAKLTVSYARYNVPSIISAFLFIIAGDNRYVPLLLFNPVVVTRRCRSSCDELLSRENVTWCARLSDVNRTLETCISVGDNGEIVSRPSSCDAHNLKLENYLTLPTVSTTALQLLVLCHYFSFSLPRLRSVELMVLVALDSLILTGFSKMPILPVLLRLTHVEMLSSLK